MQQSVSYALITTTSIYLSNMRPGPQSSDSAATSSFFSFVSPFFSLVSIYMKGGERERDRPSGNKERVDRQERKFGKRFEYILA